MSFSARQLAPIIRRIDMMIARGYLISTDDSGGIQTMQVGVLDDETIDQAERFQTYGISSVPPAGGDALVVFVQGNRDHPVVAAVNDRESRPMDLKVGEVALYSNQDCSILLNADGDVTMSSENATVTMTRAGDVTLECEGTLTLKAQSVVVETPARTFTLETHRHVDVTAGNDQTGEPV